MIERHYDDEALVTMLDSGAGAPDPHLSACGECTDKLQSFRHVTGALHDAATWDKREVSSAPNPHTIATLRAFANGMASEDSAAEAYLADLLAGPRDGWMRRLRAHPEYRTAGTVRKLIAATDRALDTMPADAVEITALATEIAEHLDSATYRGDTLARLRGAAWRERAYAFVYTGQFAKAEKAVATAETHFAGCIVEEYELARLGIVRALVERRLEKHQNASEVARSSALRLAVFGDFDRSVSARVAEAQIRFQTADFAGAFSILSDLDRHLRRTGSAATHAVVLSNLGYCAWKLGRPAEAIQYHEAAAAIADDLGNASEGIRIRWNIASILAGDGKLDQALPRLYEVHDAFKQLGMASAATEVSVEIAEVLVTRGNHVEAERICRVAMQDIELAGLAHTASALSALAIMHDAISNRTATPVVVRRVREYLRRLPDEPTLLFATAPD